MGNEKTDKTKTVAEIAADGFWLNIRKREWQSIEKEMLNLPEGEKKERFLRYTQAVENLPERSPKRIFLCHKYFVRPYVQWNEVRDVFDGLEIPQSELDYTVFILKPEPLEAIISSQEHPYVQEKSRQDKRLLDHCNKRIKTLAPLIKKLEILRKDEDFSDFAPMKDTIEIMRLNKQLYEAIKKDKEALDARYRKAYRIDKNLNKSPQKHEIWNLLIPKALKNINHYFHTGNCVPQCRIIHNTAIMKIAELLKILYPDIWTEDVNTVAMRIKQKDYRRS